MNSITKRLLIVSVATITVTSSSFAQNEIMFRKNADTTVATTQFMAVDPLDVPDLYVGEAVSVSASASGGTAPFTWSSTGTLPQGLTFSSTGVLSGTPSAPAFSDDFRIKATDANNQEVAHDVDVAVYAQLEGGTITDSLALNSQDSRSIVVQGGKGALSFTLDSGSLPTGMAVVGGEIQGTPTELGLFSSVIRVQDANGRTANVQVELNVQEQLFADGYFADAYVGDSYYGMLMAYGGSGIYNWSISSGSLPDGLILDNASGMVMGSVMTAGTHAFTGSVSDGTMFATKDVTFDAFMKPVAVNNMPSSLTRNVAVDVTMSSTGGKPPINYSAATLPTGLSINPSTGKVSGVPSRAGTFNTKITATDANGMASTTNKSVVVSN